MSGAFVNLLDAPPSRFDNPFATCWVRPGALAFRFPPGTTAEKLVATLAEQNWRGAIVGPHGSGKSTLLETLKPVLSAVGCRVHTIVLRDGQRRLPPGFAGDLGSKVIGVRDASHKDIIVVDGYEQLGWLSRVRLRHFCRRHAAGLLVTAHAPCGIPMLIQLSPALDLVEQLVAELALKVSTPITKSHVAASHACHGSNVREIFFALYDDHEGLRCRG